MFEKSPKENTKKNKYNSSLYNSTNICPVCKIEPIEDIHHINYQSLTDENGFFDNYHKIVLKIFLNKIIIFKTKLLFNHLSLLSSSTNYPELITVFSSISFI